MPQQDNDSPRAAVVTGGSGGIGRACALRLARDGFAVIVNFGSDSEKASQVVELLREARGTFPRLIVGAVATG
jgi:3-oxoacyl-[acyl-carrier protein] reductase